MVNRVPYDCFVGEIVFLVGEDLRSCVKLPSAAAFGPGPPALNVRRLALAASSFSFSSDPNLVTLCSFVGLPV